MSNQNITKKLPASIQALFGFALVAVGVNVMLNGSVWITLVSTNPQLVVQYIFYLVGILYLLSGIPSLIEGVMTMNAEREKEKLLEVPTKERK
jgi:hypothetical protein